MKIVLYKFFLIIAANILLSNAIAKNNLDLISLDFDAISVKKVLQILSGVAKKNIIFSDKITGKVSLKLDDVTWRDALNVILDMQNLAKKETKNYIYIMPQNEISKNLFNHQAPTVIIKLHFAKATEVMQLIQRQRGLLSANASINADLRTNSVLIQEIPENQQNIVKMIKKLDVPIQQVLIKGRIVTIDENFTHELGIKYSTASENLSDNNNNNNGNNNNNNNIQMDLPFSVNDPGHFGLAVAKLGEGVLLDMELDALESAGHARIISKPELLTANQKAAYIESGQEIPYQEKSSHGATTIAFKKAVLSLKVTPEIITTNKINLNLQMNQDKVSSLNVNGVPAIQTQQIQTDVQVANNETIVLGGIFEQSNTKNVIRVPLFGMIPIIGNLFSYREIQSARKELLIFVTIKLI